MLNSVYIGSNETFNNLNKKVDLLSKDGFQFPKYTKKDNMLLTCKRYPFSKTIAPVPLGLQVKWIWEDEALASSATPIHPLSFLTTTQKESRTRLARELKVRTESGVTVLVTENLETKCHKYFKSEGEKFCILSEFWTLFTWM